MGAAPTGLDQLPGVKKVGHITPSSNTVLEPITSVMNEALSGKVSHHFTRIPVRQLTRRPADSSQFDYTPMLSAAALLSDCRPDAIVWNGTAGSWLGLDHDEEICRRITGETGITASTSTLAFHNVFRKANIARIALAVPYTADLTALIGEVYARHGVCVVSEAHLGQTDNTDVGRNSSETLRQLLRDSDSADAECIAVVCTNVAATALVEEMEQELGKPIFDSIAVTFREGCRLVGVEPWIEGWGAMMRGELC